MKRTLNDYKEAIIKLPIKDKYTKDELLIEDLLVSKENNIEIYYAPHNEYINKEAKIFIIGITPGFQQMSTAIKAARDGFEKGLRIEEIQQICKREGRFSGSLRKNIISMLDDLGLNKLLNIESCSELFGDKDKLIHTVSLIPYPVFVKRENYTGHTPKLIKSKFLMEYVCNNFKEEFNNLTNSSEILLIPLGKAVEEVLDKLVEEKIISESQILKGFPHPSGANVNRLKQLEENKEKMVKLLKSKFEN